MKLSAIVRDSIFLFLLLMLAGVPDSAPLWLATVLVALSGRRRLLVLAIVNVCYFVLLGDDLTTPFPPALLLSKNRFLFVYLLRLFCVASIGGATLGLLELHKKLGYRFFITINLFVLGLMIGIYKYCPPGSLTREALGGAVNLFAKYFWAISFSLITLRSPGGFGRWTILSSFSFWTPIARFHIGAIPRGVGELGSCEQTDSAHLEQSRRSGLILVAVGAVIAVLTAQQWQFLDWFGRSLRFSQNLSIDHTATSGFTSFVWINNMLLGLRTFGRIASSVSIVVGLVRFAGFHIPLAQFKVLQARKFDELFRRIYFYYSETITYFFYIPIWNLARHFGFKNRIRTAISQFSAIVWGGIVTHALIDIPILLHHSFSGFIFSGVGRLPYLILLGALSTSSSSFSMKKAKGRSAQEPSRWRRLKALGLLLVYIFCLGLSTQFNMGVAESLSSGKASTKGTINVFKKRFGL